MTREEALFEAERAGEPVTHVRAQISAVRVDRLMREATDALRTVELHRMAYGFGCLEVRQHVPTGNIIGIAAVRP